MRAARVALFFGCLAWVASGSRAAAWPSGAESLGRAGITPLDRIEESPGAPLAGPAIGFDVWEPFAGTGLLGAGVRAAWRTDRTAFAVALQQLRSPVHRETAGVVAAQAGWPAHRSGLAVRVASQQFDGYEALWSVLLRLGASVSHHSGAAAVAQLAVGESARLVAGVALPIASGLQLLLEHERTPGLSERWRIALAGSAGPLGLAAGYDAGSGALSAGFACGSGGWRLAWGGSEHPELGWSHAWTLAK